MGNAASPVGQLLRQWRSARGMSQLDLAEQAEVSTRHISCVETGKSAPSREMVLVLASALDVPLRDRNTLLSAAGFAPVYRETDLAHDEMAQVRRALEFLLERNEPHPAVVVDRGWDVLMLNRGAQRMMALFIDDLPALGAKAGNALHVLFHPRGFRPFVVNWEELAGGVVERLHREVSADQGDDAAQTLLTQLMAYPDVPRHWHRPNLDVMPRVLIPIHLRKDGVELRLFTTLTSLGTPQDVTAQELRIESYFPADEDTDRWIRALDA